MKKWKNEKMKKWKNEKMKKWKNEKMKKWTWWETKVIWSKYKLNHWSMANCKRMQTTGLETATPQYMYYKQHFSYMQVGKVVAHIAIALISIRFQSTYKV